MKNVLLTGGGTAGHVMPCIALLPGLKREFDNVYYMGRSEGIERKLAQENGLSYLAVDSKGVDRTNLLNNLKLPFTVSKSIDQAVEMIKDKNISVVFSKGGYASYPAVMAAKKLNIPIVIHESDRTIGLANKVTKRYAAEFITSFPDTKGGTYIGNPIRSEIYSGNKYDFIKKNFKGEKPILLILGGSQGAAALNKFIISNIKELSRTYNVYLIAGKTEKERTNPEYKIVKYVENIWDCYAAADVVISRCGANSAFELAALNKKVIFVPLAGKHSRGDQIDNAQYFSAFKGMSVLNENELNLNNLKSKLKSPDKDDRPVFVYPEKVNERIVSIIKEKAKQVSSQPLRSYRE